MNNRFYNNSTKKSLVRNIDLIIHELRKTDSEANLIIASNFDEVKKWEEKFNKKCKLATSILTNMRKELQQYEILSPEDINMQAVHDVEVIHKRIRVSQQFIYKMIKKLEKYGTSCNRA